MASLRIDDRSPFHIVCITLPNGKRTTRSTPYLIDAPTAEQRRDNRALALEWGNKLERAGRKAKREGLTREEAIEIVNDILKSAGQDEIGSVTPREFFKDWLDGKSNDATNERYSHVAELFLGYLGKLADGPIGKITYKEILGFIQSRRADRIAPKTIKVDIKSLSNAFNLARKLDHIKVNPVEQALALQPIEAQSSTKGVFTPGHVTQLVLTAEGDWRTATLLGYYTGARLRDCANLLVRQIDWVHGIIVIRQGKTGKIAWVAIHPSLARHLRKVTAGLGPNDYVCPSLANRKTGGKTGLSREFAGIMRKAGIDQLIVPGKGKRRFSQLSFHSFRHTFNSHLANLGVDKETRKVMTGHASSAIDDYTHLDVPKLQGAIVLLPDVYPASAPTAPTSTLSNAA